MNVRYFELRPANKDCQDKIIDISKKKYNKVPVFEHACNYVNESSSYRRNGRHLEIVEVGEDYLIVKLTSETKLEMASKSLVGFSRELIRIDEEMNPDSDARMFTYFMYNSSLFRNTPVDISEIDQNDTSDMSDTEALKKCVDLFCNTMTSTKEQAKKTAEVKQEIKRLLSEYNKFMKK